MGVKASWNGGGKSRSFDLPGVPTGDVAGLLGEQRPRKFANAMPASSRRAAFPATSDPLQKESEGKVRLSRFDHTPGTLDEKVMPGSAVVASPGGICLRGEETNPLVAGVKLYGSVSGVKKFHGVEEIDPSGSPAHVGAKLGDESSDENAETPHVGTPYSYQMASRIVLKRNVASGVIEIYQFLKDASVSGMGRQTGLTQEKRQLVGSFIPGDAGSTGPLPYEVRWAKDVGTNGSLIIWLPGENVLSVDGDAVDTTTNLTAAGSPYHDGWYVLDLNLGTSGEIWLNVTNVLTSSATTSTASFANSASSTDSTLPIHVATVETDAETGNRSIVQNVVGALVLTRGGYNVDHDTLYYADEKSIENARSDSASAESNIFTLKGFGKFTKSGNVQYGSFSASSELELSHVAMSGASVLVRVGDTNSPNANTLGFVRLKIPEIPEVPEVYPTPFQYTETEEEQSGETVTVKSIINRAFYWDGRLITSVQDDSGFVIPLTGDVYLKCVGTKNASSQDADANGYVWTFTVGTTPATASGTQKVFNFKLYTFTNGKRTMDWRDTFLALWSGAGSGAEPDGVSIDKIHDAAPGTTPTGDEGKLEIKGFKSATSSELTLSPSSATTLEFLARNPGNPSSLVFRKLKISAADSATVKSGTIVATGVTWDTASGVNQYSIKITRGYLKVGDGNGGTTKGQIYVEEDQQETLTQRIPSVPFTPSMAQTS